MSSEQIRQYWDQQADDYDAAPDHGLLDSDVRSAYPAAMTGRAMAVFTMAMFLGVGLMQWLTGLVATASRAWGVELYAAVLGAIALMLSLAGVAFALLPAPRRSS